MTHLLEGSCNWVIKQARTLSAHLACPQTHRHTHDQQPAHQRSPQWRRPSRTEGSSAAKITKGKSLVERQSAVRRARTDQTFRKSLPIRYPSGWHLPTDRQQSNGRPAAAMATQDNYYGRRAAESEPLGPDFDRRVAPQRPGRRAHPDPLSRTSDPGRLTFRQHTPRCRSPPPEAGPSSDWQIRLTCPSRWCRHPGITRPSFRAPSVGRARQRLARWTSASPCSS
jgi:hypothetical protein